MALHSLAVGGVSLALRNLDPAPFFGSTAGNSVPPAIVSATAIP